MQDLSSVQRLAVCGNQVCEAGERPAGLNTTSASGAHCPCVYLDSRQRMP